MFSGALELEICRKELLYFLGRDFFSVTVFLAKHLTCYNIISSLFSMTAVIKR